VTSPRILWNSSFFLWHQPPINFRHRNYETAWSRYIKSKLIKYRVFLFELFVSSKLFFHFFVCLWTFYSGNYVSNFFLSAEFFECTFCIPRKFLVFAWNKIHERWSFPNRCNVLTFSTNSLQKSDWKLSCYTKNHLHKDRMTHYSKAMQTCFPSCLFRN
jgi:hypothetical protein